MLASFLLPNYGAGFPRGWGLRVFLWLKIVYNKKRKLRKEDGQMIAFLKRHIFQILALAGTALVFELMGRGVTFLLFLGSLVLLVASVYIPIGIFRGMTLVLSLTSFFVAIFMTQSIWLVLLVLVLFYWLFRGPNGNEFLVWGESLLHPFGGAKEAYHGVKLIQPQSGQRTLIKRESLIASMESKTNYYEWDDINIVFLGGSSIVDLGNTLLPPEQSTIVIRKLFGRTRLIIPRDVGFRLNISAISGAVVFENQSYSLVGENFRWETAGYAATPRRLNIMISVAFGEVEVIVL